MGWPIQRWAKGAWAAVVVGLVALDGAAAVAAPVCPPRLAVTQAPAGAPAGFRAFRNGNPPSATLTAPVSHGLASIEFSDGAPTELAWLAPDRSAAHSQVWTFAPGGGRATWVSCGYVATDVILSAPLPPTTRACTVTLDSATSPPTPTRLSCR